MFGEGCFWRKHSIANIYSDWSENPENSRGVQKVFTFLVLGFLCVINVTLLLFLLDLKTKEEYAQLSLLRPRFLDVRNQGWTGRPILLFCTLKETELYNNIILHNITYYFIHPGRRLKLSFDLKVKHNQKLNCTYIAC